jgi:hypothetical protein
MEIKIVFWNGVGWFELAQVTVHWYDKRLGYSEVR